MFNYGDRVKIVDYETYPGDEVPPFNGVTGTVIKEMNGEVIIIFDESFRDQVDDWLAWAGADFIIVNADGLEKID